MSFVIGTWNVQWQFGDWEERQPAIADVLRTLDADVIMLQESWRGQVEAELVSQSVNLTSPRFLQHDDISIKITEYSCDGWLSLFPFVELPLHVPCSDYNRHGQAFSRSAGRASMIPPITSNKISPPATQYVVRCPWVS